MKRFTDDPTLGKDGKPKPFVLYASDVEIIKLFGPRKPWTYRFLPTSYFPSLVGRTGYLGNRLKRLRERPKRYLSLAEQPYNNYRDYIYEIGAGGVAELTEEGIDFKRPPSITRPAHTLLSNMIAASFEYGAQKHELSINLHKTEGKAQPDWPVFSVGGSHPIYLEADMGTERVDKPDHDPKNEVTSIERKFECYLELLEEHPALVLFVTILPERLPNLIKKLGKVITDLDYPPEFAEMFAFQVLTPFDRFLNKIPKLSDWAVTGAWQRTNNLPPLIFKDTPWKPNSNE